jgi:hypothetical protein
MTPDKSYRPTEVCFLPHTSTPTAILALISVRASKVMASLTQLMPLVASLFIVHLATNLLTPVNLRKLLPDQSAVESFFTAAGVTFAPGLFAMLQAAAPPTIAHLKTQHSNMGNNVLKGQIGVYLHILEKKNHEPRLYVGSATGSKGLFARLNNYKLSQSLPPSYKAAISMGYRRTHTSLLAVVPLADKMKFYLQTMAVVFALESFFMFKFWTFRSGMYPKLTQLCAWPTSRLPWKGVNHVDNCIGRAHSTLLKADQVDASTPANSARIVPAIKRVRVFSRQRYLAKCEKRRLSYLKNRDAELAKSKAYRQANPERYRERCRRSQRKYTTNPNNRVKILASLKKYATNPNNKKKILARTAAWHAKNPEKVKATKDRSREKNKEKDRIKLAERVNCMQCNGSYNRGTLRRHAKTSGHRVSDNYNHQCHQCKRWFSQRGYLVKHGNTEGHTVDPQG